MTHLAHVYESQQFTQPFLEKVFALADAMRVDPGPYQLPGKVLATLFYEASTRTRLSFEAAMLRLGGAVISTEMAREFSSHSKGETLEDTIKVVSNYADVIALRHYEIGAAKRAALASKVPLINAGDGAGQHPTQALLDLYTIKRKFGEIDGLTIAMVGDLLYGRTTRSLCYLLGRFYKVKLVFVAPPICKMAGDILSFLDEHQVSWAEETDLEVAAAQADCIYMTRVQKERFLDMGAYQEAAEKYRIDGALMTKAKTNAIVMHPLPRLSEIDVETDSDPRMVFFEQAGNGLWVRMALIYSLLTQGQG
ncbi:MAG: aspartate carbamoyltransferase [Candidatus Lambdaproteobacteria bacterium RIFOXYD1_FULL_56_27]|uniref:Aspartate carbamoyltransferase n=1 Tax=Candidatus Lambdaproteobacteria bacterium RIFOXYD2_FULL_56_26 TaxID=1817773 RepID=A0A1F6GZF7_9PROT|nr:MAG: aspartate carbamoyltransferase [Candidatus Lambdaproteobacteria bacterium RIFOXYC1_FULL_56_13]OGH03434.1 MAG: aspartate carbamoyltransferase [Candidatus Lambdaproteobacteria bacterium RIFOXYD2_FULL_56_26]OGH08219.1 MAG: aspartate carbamoyltransferase [Candidatus Lambdaproteobacteria bacterium RIFOXYD1_FULL_56_27]